MVSVRRARSSDLRGVWALNDLPNVGHTSDRSVPLALPLPAEPPAAFPDLGDVHANFIDRGGDFLVVEREAAVIGMGGYRPIDQDRVEILRVRVHPAVRGAGVGRVLTAELERRAAAAGYRIATLDTATNQPEAVAFYRALGYDAERSETRPEWSWTLIYFSKQLGR